MGVAQVEAMEGVGGEASGLIRVWKSVEKGNARAETQQATHGSFLMGRF
jgi:hypothetical protein